MWGRRTCLGKESQPWGAFRDHPKGESGLQSDFGQGPDECLRPLWDQASSLVNEGEEVVTLCPEGFQALELFPSSRERQWGQASV